MKNIYTIVIILVGVFSYSQSSIDVKNIGTEDLEHMYNRLDPMSQVVIYHDNGNIYQKGFLKNDKLHGRWESFDNNGNLVVVGEYKNGKKKGKWFFWNDNQLKEVNFKNNKVLSHYSWTNSTSTIASK
jgi:antitoxin component YwqK of YwqJK toxin-antitoxin module